MKSVVEVIKTIQSGDHIFVHGAAATPQALIELLVEHCKGVKDVVIYHLHTEGDPLYAQEKYKGIFKVRNLFVGSNLRPYIDFDRVDYVPCFLSEMPLMVREGVFKFKYAFVQTSRPDAFGYVSLGTSVDVARAAVQNAEYVLAEMNSQMPKTLGDGIIPLASLSAWVETDRPLYQSKALELSDVEKKIGENVASLIEDGSCLQLGIGNIPNAVLSSLNNHRHLGLHSEMCSDGILPLIENGVLDNSQKSFHKGKSITTFLMGSEKLYRHVNNNPNFYLLEADYVNNPSIIARNSKVVSVNSAIEIDLTGQVCADSIGKKMISGVGGQIDFIRGASLSKGGKAIIAVTSRSKKGMPRIVNELKQGAGVVTTRAHIRYVVTEYGIADLYGKSLGERAKALREVAHPEDRENLFL